MLLLWQEILHLWFTYISGGYRSAEKKKKKRSMKKRPENWKICTGVLGGGGGVCSKSYICFSLRAFTDQKCLWHPYSSLPNVLQWSWSTWTDGRNKWRCVTRIRWLQICVRAEFAPYRKEKGKCWVPSRKGLPWEVWTVVSPEQQAGVGNSRALWRSCWKSWKASSTGVSEDMGQVLCSQLFLQILLRAVPFMSHAL